jgi:starch phosphorylase
MDAVSAGQFSKGDSYLFKPITDALLYQDAYLVLADFADYAACQRQVDEAYRDAARWMRMSILNVARMGKFSSDRSIREYCRDIWQAVPVPIELAPVEI